MIRSNDPTDLPVRPHLPTELLPIDDGERMRSLREMETRIHGAMASAVLRARLNGATWADVARALGVSRQAANKRWSYLDEQCGDVLLELGADDGRARFFSTALNEYLDPAGAGHRRALTRLRAIKAA